MSNDAPQDEGHADDAEQVRRVLWNKALMRGMAAAAKHVDGDVQEPGDEHEGESGTAGSGKGLHLADQPPRSFYRQHVLVIHRESR